MTIVSKQKKDRTDYNDTEYRLLESELKNRAELDRLLPAHGKINAAIQALIANGQTIRPRKIQGSKAAAHIFHSIDKMNKKCRTASDRNLQPVIQMSSIKNTDNVVQITNEEMDAGVFNKVSNLLKPGLYMVRVR